MKSNNNFPFLLDHKVQQISDEALAKADTTYVDAADQKISFDVLRVEDKTAQISATDDSSFRVRDEQGRVAFEVDDQGDLVAGGVPVKAGDGWRIRDEHGRVALEVDGRGDIVAGGVPVKAGDGWRIRDEHGQVALEVDENGRTHIHDPAFDLKGSGPVRTSPDAKFVPDTQTNAQYYPTDMNRWDRTSMINHNSSMLRYSSDEGETWELVHTFDHPVRTGIFLENGEVLVTVRESGEPYVVMRSTGFGDDPHTATWEQVIQGTVPNGGPSQAFSWSTHRNIVLMGEYGPKRTVSGEGESARRVFASRDYGKTWTIILDLLEDNTALTSDVGIHLHGVLYDPYWDRVWVTYGDDEQGTMYSDNFGKTWEIADHSTPRDGPNQVVGMAALPNCVLFATDGHPNGVLRIDRSEGKRSGPYTLEVAYLYDDIPSLTILCQCVWQADRPGNDAPVVFEFCSAPADGHRFIVTTVDGYTFNKVWEDPEVTHGNSSGRAYGPTATGQLLHYAADRRYDSGRTLHAGPMPSAY